MAYRYETLFLTGPYLTSGEAESIEKTLTKLISANGGRLLSYERWGKYRLAYPVKAHEFGIYFLMRFETDTLSNDLLKEVDALFKIKLNDLVMRYVITKLDANAPLAYQRPESLEEGGSRARETGGREYGPRGYGKDRQFRSQSADNADHSAENNTMTQEEIEEFSAADSAEA
ncbi:MAG: 30S ribosomal protein S6 [candidate division TM6 bacterium GW2011_GWE2_41_16]|nr:MAG: 30S ribosomal protein S6 [candidate division TM6 bacterium GW2011_GWE2_41_16]